MLIACAVKKLRLIIANNIQFSFHWDSLKLCLNGQEVVSKNWQFKIVFAGRNRTKVERYDERYTPTL